MKAFLVSLGCPKNTVDAEAALGFLQGAGCSVADDPRDADLLIVNACSFLEGAWRESVEELEALAKIKKAHPSKKLVLMGCVPLHRGAAWRDSLPAVDHIVPSGAHALLSDIARGVAEGKDKVEPPSGGEIDCFAGFEDRPRVTPRHFAYVKIAEGCDLACTFCAIPVIRGSMKSRRVESIVREVEILRAEGVKEISLIAQDITSYDDRGKGLADLVDSIARTGMDWIRACYVHPAALTVELAKRLFEHPAVCRYLEVPVQHASDRMLRRMGRRHTREQFLRVLGAIRDEFPDVRVRSEVLVGHPGEHEDDFEQLVDFVEKTGFSSLGVFVYSPEPGTAAASMDGRPPLAVAELRAAEIVDLQRSISFALLSNEEGKRHRVLIDRSLDGGSEAHAGCSCAGRYYGQAYEIDGEVYLRGEDLPVGEFVDALITSADEFDLEGVAEGAQKP